MVTKYHFYVALVTRDIWFVTSGIFQLMMFSESMFKVGLNLQRKGDPEDLVGMVALHHTLMQTILTRSARDMMSN